MSLPRVFHDVLRPGAAVLSSAESRHLRSVLRCRVGDSITLFDGAGRDAEGSVKSLSRDEVVVEIGGVRSTPVRSAVRLTLAVAMPRGPRQSYLFEKCTELGVWAIQPTLYERSVVKPKEDQLDKWRRTCIEAAKQCGSSHLPIIETPASFEETLAGSAEFDLTVVAEVEGAPESLATRLALVSNDTNVLVWIGPEGGLSPDELNAAEQVGAVRAHLGRHILRIETAAVAAAAMVAGLES